MDEIALANEYEDAAEWVARRGLKGANGDPLPPLSQEVWEQINADLNNFQDCVRRHAYAMAMEAHDHE